MSASRIALIPAAAGLALYGAVAGFEATRLRHTGAWTMLVAGALLATTAVGLARRQHWAYVFAMVFWVGTALGYGAMAIVVGAHVLNDGGGGEWAGVRTLLLAMIAFVGLVACVLSAMVALSLAIAGRYAMPKPSLLAWVLSAAVGLSGFGAVVWLVGYRYEYRQLRMQNQCLSGDAPSCLSLIRDSGRHTKAERRAFAIHGCESGSDSVCSELTAFLDESAGFESAEVRALDTRCQSGNPDTCQRLGVHLARIGDAENGTRYLERSCALDVRRCGSAAEAAAKAGLDAVSLRLYEQGCEREDAGACRGLLRRLRAASSPADFAPLELHVCLIGDVNDCLPLMRRDLRGVCPRICEGTTESRMHTCGYCARQAESEGERALAEEWFAGTCQSGYRWGCDDLVRLRSLSPDHAPRP